MADPPPPIKLVTRTRNKWKSSGKPKSIDDNAIALGYIVWQLALNAAKNLHIQDFRFDDDRQRVHVIEEYAVFLVHVSDRIVFEQLDTKQRTMFVSGLASAVARHVQRNEEEILGSNDYRGPFLTLLNRRGQEYAACPFSADQPGYSMLRALSCHILEVIGADQTNKWVVDQVMEIDAPDVCRQLRKSLLNLFESM